jgi:hypothetical protein
MTQVYMLQQERTCMKGRTCVDSQHGRCALDYAVEARSVDAIKVLIEAGANVDRTDEVGTYMHPDSKNPNAIFNLI